MLYRATSLAVTNRATFYSAQHGAAILKLQQHISSGIKISRSADDPLAFQRITGLRAQLDQLDTAKFMIGDAETKLNISVTQLTEVHNLLTSARTLVQQAIQSVDNNQRQALALEAEGILGRLKTLANSQANGQFLYAGAKSNLSPFSFDGPISDGGTLNVQYHGSQNSGISVISPSVTVETLRPGTSVFYQDGRQSTILYGKTGAAIGTGIDTLIGRATLQVRHTATNFDEASGITSGTSSIGGDNIIGPLGAHRLTINDESGMGAFGTISLNGGPKVAFTNSDTNLKIEGPAGEVIFVNTTAISPGFNATVDIEGQGTLSVDGGLTTIPINHSSNQVVTDSNTGRFANINSTQIRRSGDDYLEFPQTSNVFQTLHELVQDLRGGRQIDGSQLTDSLNRRLGELDRLDDQILSTLGLQSTHLKGLQEIRFRNDDLKYESETQLNDLQATDLSEAVIRLQNEQALQQFTYAITSQILSQSLLDFLV